MTDSEILCSLMCDNIIPSTEITICKRCGRKLKNPDNIKLGMGLTCYRKYKKEQNHKKLFEY